MYYPQQSPGIAQKLPTHHDPSPWSRSHHPVLGPPGTQPGPPPSPGYPLYTNGTHNPMQQHPAHLPHPLTGHPPQMPHHHHHTSISHFSSPPNGQSHQQHGASQASPGNASTQLMAPHWQQQLLKCEVRHRISFESCS